MTNSIFRKARLLAAKYKKRFSDATMAAYALGISPTTLYRIERGEIEATPHDCANMVNKYQSYSLAEDYCATCPVKVAKNNLESISNRSSAKLKKMEDIINE